MKKLFTKQILLMVVMTLFCINYSFADENDSTKTIPITLNPVPKNDPNKPKSPSQVRLSAYYDGSAVVLTSTVATMAEVVISDTESGAYCFNGLAALAPDFRCPVTATPGSSLMITVSIGSTVYEGILIL